MPLWNPRNWGVITQKRAMEHQVARRDMAVAGSRKWGSCGTVRTVQTPLHTGRLRAGGTPALEGGGGEWGMGGGSLTQNPVSPTWSYWRFTFGHSQDCPVWTGLTTTSDV